MWVAQNAAATAAAPKPDEAAKAADPFAGAAADAAVAAKMGPRVPSVPETAPETAAAAAPAPPPVPAPKPAPAAAAAAAAAGDDDDEEHDAATAAAVTAASAAALREAEIQATVVVKENAVRETLAGRRAKLAEEAARLQTLEAELGKVSATQQKDINELRNKLEESARDLSWLQRDYEKKKLLFDAAKQARNEKLHEKAMIQEQLSMIVFATEQAKEGKLDDLMQRAGGGGGGGGGGE